MKISKKKIHAEDFKNLEVNKLNLANGTIDFSIPVSENLYYKGEYKKSLELTANMLERIEPGIYNRLVKKYVQ